MKRLAAMLSVLVALCITLVGCGGGSGASKVSGDKFVDTWTVISMTSGDDTFDEETMDYLRAFGMVATIRIKDDGTFIMTLDDDVDSGTWKASTEVTGVLSLDGSDADMALTDDNALKVTQGDTTMVLTRGELPVGTASTSSSGSEDSQSINVPVANDDLITMTFTSKALDIQGDPTLYFSVTNNSSKTIYITEASASINGVSYNPVTATTVGAGVTLDNDYLFFDAAETDITDLDDFKNITLELEVWDDATNETIGTYSVTID